VESTGAGSSLSSLGAPNDPKRQPLNAGLSFREKQQTNDCNH